ncbi:MAG: DUF1772 domain-containing protein [Bacteroidia bacterium]
MISIQHTLVFFSLLFSGLIAGLLFSYSCSVNPGLKTIADIEYIKTMQAINVAIQNPAFLIPFMGLCLILPISTIIIYRQHTYYAFYPILAATITYIVGVFGVTMFCNVPLNEQLAKFSSQTTTSEIHLMRQSFEKPWNTYHIIRTVASLVSFGLTVISAMKIRL